MVSVALSWEWGASCQWLVVKVIISWYVGASTPRFGKMPRGVIIDTAQGEPVSMRLWRLFLPVTWALTLLLVACETGTTPTYTIIPIPTPTSTLVATATAIPTPTVKPVSSPTPTTSPTATPTALPPLTPTPTTIPEPFAGDIVLALRETMVRVIGSNRQGSGTLIGEEGLVVTSQGDSG
jgi:hypothetical protein